jgi:hypothetical protein
MSHSWADFVNLSLIADFTSEKGVLFFFTPYRLVNYIYQEMIEPVMLLLCKLISKELVNG